MSRRPPASRLAPTRLSRIRGAPPPDPGEAGLIFIAALVLTAGLIALVVSAVTNHWS